MGLRGRRSGVLQLCTTAALMLALSSAQEPSGAGQKQDIPEGASTLAFVFDVTGSMYDDLVQVIEGASKILETSLSRPKRPLYNFALIPFHDPEIGPVTITTDPKKFQYELRELYVQGGGDCPEMSIGAIKIALEISLPGSFIYVFTDARSKDYKLTNEVLQLIQQKQSQVVFVLTGDCDDRAHIGYKVYEEIASTSSGQIFHLDKKQVNEVLKWVEEAVQASKVHLLSTDHHTGTSYSWQIPFDPSLKEVTVALSGPAPLIEIRDPQGKLIKKGAGLNELLHIPNSAKVVNVKDPNPGMWSIKTSSSGRHSIRISGLSTIDFRAGFARRPTLDFKKTSSRPVQGIPTFVLLNTTGIIHPARADRLELLSTSGEVLKTIPIKFYPDRKPYGIWNVTEFIPPDEAFFLKVTGYDTSDYMFQRVSSVSFSSVIPDAPKVLMPPRTQGYYLQNGSISCYIESLIPFTLRFSRDGVKLGLDQFFRESASATLEFDVVSLEDEGYYECIAINSAGTGRAQTYLDVSEPPPIVQVLNNVTVIPGERAILTCLISSTVHFNLTWMQGGIDVKLRDPTRVRMMNNLSLEIHNVNPSDAGEYSCIATNEGGATSGFVHLVVQEPPQVIVEPRNQTFVTGQDVRIRCSAKGYPKPHLVWTQNDIFIIGSNRYRLTLDGTLIIKNAAQRDSGIYSCLASNPAGTDRQTSALIYIEAPKVSVVQPKLLTGLGDITEMECKVSGIPDPKIKWYKGDLELQPSPFIIFESVKGILRITETRDIDAGDYICLAINDAGKATGKLTLDVGSAPVFFQEPADISADIGTNITLPCMAQGYPQPRIKWKRPDSPSVFPKPYARSTITETQTGNLIINNLSVEDEGNYICEAENQFGKIWAQTRVTVTGLVTPLIGISPEVVNVIEGQQITLPCVFLSGNPLPERQWLKNNVMLNSNPYLTIRRDGSLHIERVQLQDGGKYTCLARNVAGRSNRTTTVNIFVLPTIQHGPQVFSTIEGIPITLPCRANGVPKPDITWSKKGELIDLSGRAFSLNPDGSLFIVSPTGNETGEFVCTATNAAGYTSKKVQLTVYVKPRVSGQRGKQEEGNGLVEISVIAGEDVILPCEVQSIPPPIITWAKDMQLISPFSPRHTLLSSGSMKVIETRVSDSGLYLCVATNIAGNVTQAVKLSVNVAPKIQAGPRVIKVLVGHKVDIPCIAQGLPPPVIRWLKDKKEFGVTEDGILTIKEVTLSDAGFYKCVARNVAGQDEAEIHLLVQVPPVVEELDPPYNTPFQERIANQRIAFPCPAKGNPTPVIRWQRNGKELTGNEPGVSILEDGTLLIIASLSPLDNGEYVCVAVNDAGSTERKYQLKVHVPPNIMDNEKPSNVSAVVNQPVSLFCDATGNPLPLISWFKDNLPIISNSNVQILNNGKTLRLLKVGAGDAARYTCNAINIAGSTEKNFILEVLVPPSIAGVGSPNDISVILNHAAVLECRVKGVPFPSIQWFKESKPLFLDDPNIEVLNKGQVIKIKATRIIDQGLYQCIVSNTAGKQTKDFKFNVYVPPTIKGGNVTTELSAFLKSPVSLECEARGMPVPAITWYRDGQPIIASHQVLYNDRGHFLQIPQAQLSDAGRYTCRATSIAGSAEKTYLLDILVAPTIEGDSDIPMKRKVVVNNPLSLECDAGGQPPPTLTWLKDGVPAKNSDNIRIIQRGRKLEILNAAVSDSGTYTCIATSVAGEKQITYNVNVLVPPSLERLDESTDSTVIVNGPLELYCLAKGTPPPQIKWLKDGQPVRQRDGLKMMSNGQKLVISQAQVSDIGHYQCIATNEAGEQKKEFNVAVHVPPSIRSGGQSERSVVVHQPITLQCIANGIPNPSITWLKDGRPVSTARGHAKLESMGRVLQIVNALLEDAGTYTCIATNAAGEAQQHVRLTVNEPPIVENGGDILNETAIINSPIQLECKVSGNPLPAVTWYKDSRPITSSAGVTLLNRGQILQIDSAQVSDTGIYKCVAINIAGTSELIYSLQVYVPPSISGSSDMVTVVVNNAVRLECEARGIPVPGLTWLKDGSPVASFTNGIQLLSGGRVLSIASSQIRDTGKYTCVAVNAAGEEQRDIQLRVYVPPDILGEEQNVSVVMNQMVVMLCQSNAVPPPTLRWFKDDHPLLRKPGLIISEDGSTLKIESSQVQDTGRYTCEATNIAGKTEKNFNLNVWVPPSILGADEVSQLTVIEGSLITLVCESSGIPPPNLTWKKNGALLKTLSRNRVRALSGGRQLQISSADKSDAATYSCVASNLAGNAMKEYILQVYVRPTILHSGMHPSEVTVSRGNGINLECDAQGTPRPALTWLKDGRPVVNGRSVQVLSDGRLLQIKNSQVSDTGRYMCVAVNMAGQVDRKYDVNVHVPPTILGDLSVPDNITVLVKNPVVLNCEATGIPLPVISWLKDGHPVNLSSSAKILSGGRLLRLMHATIEDAGRYTCIASNSAGENKKNFDLDILIPPSIIEDETQQDVKVKEKHSITLTCEVSGHPVPKINWMKDDQPLVEDDRHKVISNGRFLQILSAQVVDTGRYTCLASNTAGDKTKNFNLNVLVSPTINGMDQQETPEEVTVTLNSPTSLVCEAQSYPPATIMWLKDGVPFESNKNIRILPGGRTLQILTAQKEDAGRYTCVATNEAGETLKNYEVKVYIPPIISKEDLHDFSPKEIKIKVNNSLTLECEAQAFPTATLRWFKDGQALNANHHVSITANGRILQLRRAQISDTGRYTCVASNLVGEDEKDFDVNILVPPSFTKQVKEKSNMEDNSGTDIKDVVVNNPISLYCETNAVPPPTLRWYKDGQLLASSDKVLILPGGRILQIPRALPEDAGKYTCVAINEAGEDSIHYEVRVLLPPIIKGADEDVPKEMITLVNKTAIMECLVSGSPAPKISWLKDGRPVTEGKSLKILFNGKTLQVTRSQITDTGRYVCVAENAAGSAEKYFNLNVHVPPIIMGMNPENVTVVLNNFISLTCEATGFPPPALTWLKDGKPVQHNSNMLIMPGGRTLQILRAKLSDGGKYSCVAVNQAGEKEKIIFLTVFVPPSIKDHSGDSPTAMSVRVGNSVTLECESNAIPPPMITWYKNGRMIADSANIKILAEGQILEITKAEVSDTGQYVCKATNIAGQVDKNFHLNVYMPPSIDGPKEQRLLETISNPVTFACDATGIPPPTLTWLKNGRPVENTESLEMHILSGGSKLQIARSQLSDSGTYICVASNIEGKAQKIYHLDVQVPPSIKGSEMPSDVSVIVNESVQLICNVEGTPRPTLQWLKDGNTFTMTMENNTRISPDGSTLSITGAQPANKGKYTCVATNSAGEEDRIFTLNVYVPPSIMDNGRNSDELTVILDSSINIECVANGFPAPQLNWLKNGLPLPISSHIRLLSAGQVLRVVRAQTSDAGIYTCVASNRAGVENKHFNVQVYVPPRLVTSAETETVVVVKGEPIALLCISDGTPAPSLSWMKNGQPLSADGHISILNQGTAVQMTRAELEDAGMYTCVATNEAGEASKHFDLMVLDPPRINGSDIPEEVSVIENHALELHCISTGVPIPELTWMKDGRPMPAADGIFVLRGGNVLYITSIQVEDAGRYTCLASSPAGDDEKEYLVRVHVPPNIAGTSDPQDVSVLENMQAMLECKSDAIPPPTLTWLRNGKPLQSSPRIRILSNGRYLQINNAELGDRANYTCVASNIAGNTTREFIFNVQVAPTIQDGPQTLSVHVDKPAVLECIVSGVPAPRITWRKDGVVMSGSNPRYSIMENGSLHIFSAQVTDTGRYLCMATNPAGSQRKKIDLQIFVPPSIVVSPTDVTATVNIQITLPCEATGFPKPDVVWKKNGRVLNTDHNQNMYRVLSSGSLVVIAATVEDSAIYECVVSNDAGKDQRSMKLTVQVPPSIADEQTELLVMRLSPVIITCTASGVPEPAIHWFKDGVMLPTHGHEYTILPSGPVEITAADHIHSGRYTCTASSPAGSAHRQVHLTVQEPPMIQTHPSTLDVILNNPITLPCEASGTPRPTITWQKEGINILPAGENFTVLPNGGLQIIRSKVEDSGTYICVAQNPAGTALGKTKLRVQVPPSIKSQTKAYIVALDKSVTLSCEAEGYPVPEVKWHKDSHQVKESVRQRVLSSGALHIAFAQPTDAGRYTCTVANVAGSSSSDMSLTVHMPPNIRSMDSEYSVLESSQVALHCIVDGVPQPHIFWEKEGVPLSEGKGKYTIKRTGELIIGNTLVDDAGSYTCIANNTIGESSRTVNLIVHTHPAIMDLLGDVALNKGQRLLLTCAASGIPTPTITWAFNNNIIPAQYESANGHSELLIERVNKEDSGTYTCIAENSVGSVKSIGFVYVKEPPIFDGDTHSNKIEPLGGNAILNCEVRGDPPPVIQWNRKGINIQISNRIRQLDNGSLAIYGTVNEDAGSYICVARNDAGVAERRVTLTLQSPPTITVEPVETVVDAGNTLVLNCQARGEPPPAIEWTRQGLPLHGNERISILSNHSLRIIAAQKEDTSEYECVARNLMGSVLIRVPVTVQVHGEFSEWMDWGPCSVTCGQGVQKRLRQCNNPLPANGGRHCIGPEVEKRSCQAKRCPVDGNWSEWSTWEECTRTCGQGNRTRVRSCTNPSSQHGGKACEGKAVDLLVCNVRPCPVAGNWGTWLPWGPCSETCGKGTQTRLRLCNNPPPSFDGPHCDGTDMQTQVCNERNCPVDGKWTSWMTWTACSVSCGGGTRQRTRTCTSPSPQYGGRQCEGNDVHIDFCNNEPCPTHGNWGPWNSWGSCSRTCNGGQMRRYRTCDNPRPANGGRACAGADTQIQRCNTDICPVDGNWGPWQSWNECSASCGGGERTRVRLCNNPPPVNEGRSCPGDSSQVSKCNIQACPGGPHYARGSVIGNINDIEFGIALLNATITESEDSSSKIIQATITNVPRSLGPAMRKLISILNPIYWTTAKEIGEAMNGYSLTGAVFRRETQVEFATGEILRMTHVARGLDSDGALLLDIVINGYILQLPSTADVNVKDYTEDYIQTGPGQIYAYSTRMFSIDKISVPYSWNHTITYDSSQGRMPFLVETLQASSMTTEYHPLQEMLEYKVHATISKGDRSNQCPSGFRLDSAGPYCADENECSAHHPCSHTCHNTMGTYYCSCPQGLTISADGRTCQDINECVLGGHTCHGGQDCENTIGSYRCVVRCGQGFRRTSDGLSCQDINECQESNPCHQRCLNIIGSFRCTCEPGFHLRNRRCFDINECRQNVCRSDQQCKNTRGGYKCIDLCPSGMTKVDNGTCLDIDECRDGIHQCRYNQICENTRGSYHCSCPRGYRSQGVGQPCLDINECETKDVCQHECMNIQGSYKCLCPSGYRLMLNGKTCQDIDECAEQNIQCGVNRMCFNMRGSYQCIDTPCPPNYQRDPATGFCLKNCLPNDLECALSPYALEYKLVSLPFGIAANQDLIRLVAYTQDGVVHPRTTFFVVDEDATIPFAIRDENLKGVVFTIRPLREPHTYRMKVRALSYSADGSIEYQTTFIVYIAVSAYPY
ncbi:hemicentin-1 isoform X2 [Polypterus senegalus]|uniref:hemicentin-1 isoform X2 n=1 Tax=Polypterus senegalus TaxID=55291 RepID=UPI0019647851|nr:hemicentin-1 isoform X2 [Polypterus senegalus]